MALGNDRPHNWDKWTLLVELEMTDEQKSDNNPWNR
jgi:hypothetical protein